MSTSSPHPEEARPTRSRLNRFIDRSPLILIAVLILVSTVRFFLYPPGRKHGWQLQAVNNCRQIMISLKAYAADHQGHYPEGATANEAFRKLIKEGQLEDERIFTAPASPFVPDNDLGEPPDYAKAVERGENHWAMTKGLTDESDGNTPAVFENPAVKTWPPKWDTRIVGQPKLGRVWKGGRVIVGRNDGSINIEKLKEGEPMATLAPFAGGKNIFELAGPHEILDVEK